MTALVDVEQEEDGRWLAEVLELLGVLAYGESRETVVSRMRALARRVVAERLDHGEAGPELVSISFAGA
jgi:predicted RNase H-like HicB family nuclease